MTTILIRTLIIYFSLILTMRLMGKRQIGELEVTELITTLLLSEIASLPITNQDIPVSYALIPMITLLTLEVTASYLMVRFPACKWLFSANPSILVRHGKLDQQLLLDLRLSAEELMTEVRRQGLTDLAEVDYAILEKNGKITILPKANALPPTGKKLGLDLADDALMHIVFCNGSFSKKGLRLVGKSRAWLESEMKKRNLDPKRIFCITADESGKLYWIEKEEKL